MPGCVPGILRMGAGRRTPGLSSEAPRAGTRDCLRHEEDHRRNHACEHLGGVVAVGAVFGAVIGRE